MEAYLQSRRLHKVVRRTAATRPMALLYGVIQQPLDRLVYRVTRRTLSSWLGGVEIAMLTTTGARSGVRRTLPVLALREGGELILIASNFGRARNPGWYHNLRADPHATIVLDGVARPVVAHELAGAERERAYARGEAIYPGFTRYRGWAAGRQIPVLRLSRPE
jgi:deazaflavin-dependent oxidoreductase (nitroreductase family)